MACKRILKSVGSALLFCIKHSGMGKKFLGRYLVISQGGILNPIFCYSNVDTPITMEDRLNLFLSIPSIIQKFSIMDAGANSAVYCAEAFLH